MILDAKGSLGSNRQQKAEFGIDEVERGVKFLVDAGINARSRLISYVLVGFNSTPDEDKFRVRKLKSLGVTPFVMQYSKTNWTRRLAHWANRPALLWSCDIDDYWRVNDKE